MRTTENTAKRPTGNAGFLATLSNLFRGQGTTTSATDRKGTSVTRLLGASAGRGRLGLLALATAATALLALTPAASATLYVDRIVAGDGTIGTAQGLFGGNGIQGVVLNDPGVADGTTDPLGASTDGYVYVVDRSNQRIQVFGPDDSFKFTFGGGVEDGGDGAQVCDSSEVPCTSPASGGDEEGEFSNPGGIAINQATGDLYVLDANRRVSQFTAAGQFIRAWGWDVAAPTSPDNIGTGFEICTASCKSGTSGGNGGQLDSPSFFTNTIAIDPAAPHHVFVGDGSNRRVQEFEPDGDFVRLWGTDVVVEGQPGDIGSTDIEICASIAAGVCKPGASDGLLSTVDAIAVDGTDGSVYVSAGNASAGIVRFDSDEAAAGDLLKPAVPYAGLAQLSDSARDLDLEPESGHLLILVSKNTATDLLELADPATNPTHVDTHFSISDSSFTIISVAANPTSGELYFGTTGNGRRLFAGDGDGAAPPADSEINPAREVEAHSATLNGCVDPLGTSPFTASYRFQYSLDGKAWTDAAAPKDLGSAAIDCDDPANELQAPISGLLANTTYRARIVTNRQFGNPDVFSAEVAFTTDALNPVATTFPPSIRTDDSAVLAGTVNPHGASTTFRFEWGKTASYGKEVPAFPGASAGEGGVAQPQARLIEGLAPATTYHYRLCAQSVKGSHCGEDRSFTTRPSFAGFPQRGYEQVTRVGTVFAGINQLPYRTYDLTVPVAADGEALAFAGDAFTPDAPIGDTPFPGARPTVIARRSAEGWRVGTATPRPAGTSAAGTGMRFSFLDSETNRGVLSTTAGWLADPEPRPGTYLRDYAGEGLPNFIAPTSAPPEAATADLSHLVFESAPRLIADLGPGDFLSKVYEWEAGELRLVSYDEAGNPFTGPSSLGAPRSAGLDLDAISADGRQIFFSSPLEPAGATKVYRRSDGERTELASPSRRSPVDPAGQKGKTYEAASASGDRVFFTSAEQLTDDANTGPSRAGTDLYRYEHSTDTLIDISAETNTTDGARVVGFMGSSEDGDWAYYVALGQPLAGKGAEGKRNVYAWHDDGSAEGQTRFVATLGDGVADTYSFDDFLSGGVTGDANTASKRSHVSADGKSVVFQSAESLTAQQTRGHTQIYAYEAGADGGAGALSCVSCRPDGGPSAGGARVAALNSRSVVSAGGAYAVDGEPGRAISADGRRIVFHSTDALLGADRNEAADVYLWEEGRLSLISSGAPGGAGEQGSFFVGMSPSGEDVFFFTREPLVGQDAGDSYDIYDARIGGGIAAQSPPPPGEPCVADRCKPTTETPPSVQAPRTVQQRGGNFLAPVRIAKPNRKQLRRAARKGKLLIRVRANQSGRVVIRAIKGKRVLGVGSKAIFRPGPTKVLVKLRRFARRTLHRRGKLRFRIEATLAGERQALHIKLRRAK